MTCNLISTTRAVEMTFFRSRLEKKKVENFGRLTSVHFLSIFEGCPFVPNNALGKFKLLRALISPTAKNEPPDWLIFARALLCHKGTVSVAKRNSLASDVFFGKEEISPNNWRWGVLSVLRSKNKEKRKGMSTSYSF